MEAERGFRRLKSDKQGVEETFDLAWISLRPFCDAALDGNVEGLFVPKTAFVVGAERLDGSLVFLSWTALWRWLNGFAAGRDVDEIASRYWALIQRCQEHKPRLTDVQAFHVAAFIKDRKTFLTPRTPGSRHEVFGYRCWQH